MVKDLPRTSPALVLLMLVASARVDAAPTCDGPEARQAIAALQARLGEPALGRGRVKAAAGVYRRYVAAPQRLTSAGPDLWLFTHAGAPLFVDTIPIADDGAPAAPIRMTACAYRVLDERLDQITPRRLVESLRQRLDASGPTPLLEVPGLGGFSFTEEWRGPRLVTLVFVEASDGVRYRLRAATAPPPTNTAPLP